MRELEVSTQATLDYLTGLGFRFVDIEAKIGRAQPDIIVYNDQDKIRPIIVAEVKRALPSDLELLHPAVQQAFRYSALLGNKSGHLLVSDGENHHWFQLTDDGASLQYAEAPKPPNIASQGGENDGASDQIFHFALQRILASLGEAGIRIDLRSSRDVLRIVVARMVAEEEHFDWQMPTIDVRQKIGRTLDSLFPGPFSMCDEWTLPKEVALEAIYSLKRISRDRLLSSSVARSFWIEIEPLLIDPDRAWISPRSLATFLVALIAPKPGERIIDPACGTAQFLVEADIFLNRGREPKFLGGTDNSQAKSDLIGFERNSTVAEIARLNLILSGLGAGNIHQDDSLASPTIQQQIGKFDLVICDPPIGKLDSRQRDLKIAGSHLNATKLETAFVEQAVHLLKPGGRAALLLPEGFFFSQDRQHFREWLLNNVRIDAVISLPPGAWTTARSHTQASVLLFTKCQRHHERLEYPIFIADLRTPGVPESYSPAGLQSRLNQTLESYLAFLDASVHQRLLPKRNSVGSIISSNFLSSERLDVAGILLEARHRSPVAVAGKYSVVKLVEVADIILGRHIKKVGDRNPTSSAANYIQAGNVRRFDINLSDIPRITANEAEGASAASLISGDVLITSTGQYLGRAALISETHLPAVASNAVTILRIRETEQIDPRYLVAFLNSPAGVEQIEQRRIKGVAQPYLRRGDIEDIAVPLPPLEVQKAAAEDIWQLLSRAEVLDTEAGILRERAHTLLLDVLNERRAS